MSGLFDEHMLCYMIRGIGLRDISRNLESHRVRFAGSIARFSVALSRQRYFPQLKRHPELSIECYSLSFDDECRTVLR